MNFLEKRKNKKLLQETFERSFLVRSFIDDIFGIFFFYNNKTRIFFKDSSRLYFFFRFSLARFRDALRPRYQVVIRLNLRVSNYDRVENDRLIFVL